MHFHPFFNSQSLTIPDNSCKRTGGRTLLWVRWLFIHVIYSFTGLESRRRTLPSAAVSGRHQRCSHQSRWESAEWIAVTFDCFLNIWNHIVTTGTESGRNTTEACPFFLFFFSSWYFCYERCDGTHRRRAIRWADAASAARKLDVFPSVHTCAWTPVVKKLIS